MSAPRGGCPCADASCLPRAGPCRRDDEQADAVLVALAGLGDACGDPKNCPRCRRSDYGFDAVEHVAAILGPCFGRDIEHVEARLPLGIGERDQQFCLRRYAGSILAAFCSVGAAFLDETAADHDGRLRKARARWSWAKRFHHDHALDSTAAHTAMLLLWERDAEQALLGELAPDALCSSRPSPPCISCAHRNRKHRSTARRRFP